MKEETRGVDKAIELNTQPPQQVSFSTLSTTPVLSRQYIVNRPSLTIYSSPSNLGCSNFTGSIVCITNESATPVYTSSVTQWNESGTAKRTSPSLAQTAHWSYDQVTLNPVASYCNCHLEGCSDIVEESIVFISDNHKHDNNVVQHFFKTAVNHLLAKDNGCTVMVYHGIPWNNMEEYHGFSPGCNQGLFAAGSDQTKTVLYLHTRFGILNMQLCGGIKDDIPCGQIPSNVKIVPINFDFDNLVNESCNSGNITDEINIDRCIDNMDNTLAKRHPIVTLLRDIRRFDRDTLPVYANINNATFSPRFGSDDASTFFKLKLQEFNSTVKLNFREFLTVSVKEYADKLTTEVEQYWHQTSASINNGSSIVRLNDRVRSLKEKWADKYRQSATRDTKELSDLERIKQELEVLRQQTDKGQPISEMDLMKKEIDDLKNVLGNRYGRANRGRGRRNFRNNYY
ncbi:DCTN1 [Mytilus coruscus]|uniref:DCTN1 n=1 Tax=Mytilus coruscus TaxID=42192 RepID=A0A6J8DFM5_MYTCO|nr:DCTN1 [Mytilus coruscus]